MQENNYPEILQELRDTMTDTLEKQGIEPDKAKEAAYEVAEILRINWGGMQIYICKALEYRLSERDLKIWHEFKGRNHHELIRKYDISLQRLYKIIKIQRRKNMQERQGDLFE